MSYGLLIITKIIKGSKANNVLRIINNHKNKRSKATNVLRIIDNRKKKV